MITLETGFLYRLETALKSRGISRSTLAATARVNLNTVHGYWKYNRIPRGDDLVRIAGALGTSAEYLVTGHYPEKPEEDPVTGEIIAFIRELDEQSRTEVYGALKMLRYIKLTGSGSGYRAGQ